MINVKIPGKLYIAGEYSILKPGNEAVLVAVNKFVNLTISPSKYYLFKSELGSFRWMNSNDVPVFSYHQLKHAKSAIYVSHLFLRSKNITPKVFRINLNSELMDHENKKYGLGSSSAVIVAVIRAILSFHSVFIDNLVLFKLSVLAQIEINDMSSGGDLAVSIYGGYVRYRRYDNVWVLNNKGKIEDFVNLDWPLLEIEKLEKPNLHLAVCHSGLIKDSTEAIEVSNTIKNEKWYNTFLNKANLIVKQLIEAIIRNDYFTVKQMLDLFRTPLLEFESKTNTVIESKPFKEIIKIANDLGFSAKTSGSGYGDCAISLLKNKDDLRLLEDSWRKKGFNVFSLEVWDYYG